MRTHIKILTLLLVIAVTATSSTAFAQTGAQGYRNSGERVAGAIQGTNQGGGDAAGTVDDGGGSLPFTGLDVALILGVGGVLLAVGLGTRRLTRQTDAA